MIRRTFLAVLTAAVVVPAAEGGYPSPECQITFRDRNGRKLYLAVVDGKLTAVAPDRAGDSAVVWYVLGTRIKSTSGRGYLAYDLSGNDRRVFLAPEPGENTEWRQTLRAAKPNDPTEEEGWTASFHVAKGKCAGLGLCLKEVEQAGTAKGAGGPTYQVVVGGPSLPQASAWRETLHK